MASGQDLLRVALAQINPTVGDIDGNAAKIAEQTAAARDAGAALVVFPELALSGYPPEDLLLKTRFLDDAPRRARRAGRADARASWRWSASPSAPRTSTTPRRCSPTARSRPSTARCTCPTTASSTSSATSRAAPRPAIFELNGIPIGLSICEDIWEPGPPAMTEALAGAQVIVNLSASPYRVGYGHAPRAHARAARRRQPGRGRVRATPSAARTSSSSTGTASPSTRTARILARCPQFEESLTLCTIDPREVASARLRDTRHRANVRRQRRAAPIAEPPVVHMASLEVVRRRRRPSAARSRRPARARGGGLRRAAHRPARLRAQERLRARRARPLGRHRLRAGRPASRSTRSARSGSRACRCPRPTRARARRADARAIAANLGVDFREISIADAMQAYDEMLAEPFAGTRARHRRGERAGAHPRQPA